MANRIDVEAELLSGQTIQMSPTGYSMYPLLDPKKGDQIILNPAPETVKRGDIVVYRRDGEVGQVNESGENLGILVLHRITKVEGDSFYACGDNQSRVEGPIRKDQIRGIMTARVRAGKTLPMTGIWVRCYAKSWLFLRPLRPVISKTAARIKRIFAK